MKKDETGKIIRMEEYQSIQQEIAELRSQLEEMVRLPDGDRQMIGPEAAREDIRELKRFNKAEPAEGEADDIRQLVEKFFEGNPDVLNEIFVELEQGAANADGWEWLKEIVNPSGNRSCRAGLFFLMMYEDCLKFKKFGSEPEKMQWEEFFRLTTELFGAAAAGSKTWENYFGKADQADGKGEETAACETMELVMESRSENEEFARVVAAVFASRLDPTLEELDDIKTAVSEAVTNAVIHGYRGGKGKITLAAAAWEKERLFSVTVRDEGVGIADVEQAMEPMFTTCPEDGRSGMGFSFMEAFMDQVEVVSAPGKGTSVTMKKKIGR